MSAVPRSALQRRALARWLRHAVSASLVAASILAAVCIERTNPDIARQTALEPSPSAMF